MKTIKKFLLVWPNSVSIKPKHVNIPYHFVHFGEVLGYLNKDEAIVASLDCEALNINTNEVLHNIVENEYLAVGIFVDNDNLSVAMKTVNVIKDIRPNIKILAYGDLPVLCPDIFLKSPFDAIAVSGHQERAIKDYFEYVDGKREVSGLRSIYIISGGSFIKSTKTAYLPAEEWGWSDISTLPLESYDEMQGKEQMVITISRGCPFGCKFCNATLYYGAKEQRRDIDKVIQYIKTVSIKYKKFKFFSPNFTLDANYVIEFCKALHNEFKDITWSCTSRVDLLQNEEMIKWMSKAGCTQVAVGVESLNTNELEAIDKVYDEQHVKKAVNLLQSNGINFKALIMLGVPNQTKESLLDMLRKLSSWNVPVRPTAYTPMQNLNASMSIEEIESMDKRTYYMGIEGINKCDFLNLIFNINNFEMILGGTNNNDK